MIMGTGINSRIIVDFCKRRDKRTCPLESGRCCRKAHLGASHGISLRKVPPSVPSTKAAKSQGCKAHQAIHKAVLRINLRLNAGRYLPRMGFSSQTW